MDFEGVVWKESVREGYVVLLRAEMKLLLPTKQAKIRDFYQKTARACLSWACEVWGGQLKSAFCALDNRSRGHFHTRHYRFTMRIAWECAPYISILCESERDGTNGSKGLYRIAHLWNEEEETVLPPKQILHIFRPKLAKNELSFSPDGIYREQNEIVIFKNPTSKNEFLEARLPII
jgi:hypothetical protein